MYARKGSITLLSWGIGLAFALLGIHSVSSVVHAQTFTVTKTEDTADGTCDSDCSLREAIITANEREGPDTIMLGPGAYLLTLSGNNEDASTTGDLDITTDMTILGAGLSQTIIDAGGFDSNNRDRIFHMQWPWWLSEISPTVVISGVTVQNGFVDSYWGGGIHIERATVDIYNSAILSSSVGSAGFYYGAGGGINATESQFVLTNSVVRLNRAGCGGGIRSDAGQISVLNSAIEGNQTDICGAGLWVTDNRVLIDNSVIRNNQVITPDEIPCGERRGGGIYYNGEVGYTTVFFHLTASEVSNNTIGEGGENCLASYGGGIAIDSTAENDDIQIKNSAIVSNSAVSAGGIQIDYATIISSTISDNRATGWDAEVQNPWEGSGGGIYATWNTKLINSVVSHNSAAKMGGGWYNRGANHAISDSLIAHNTAGVEGGGLWSEGVNIFRSTIRDNTAQKGGGLSLANSQISESTISNNLATEDGGGINIAIWGSETFVRNSTISGNSAKRGGAINHTVFSTNLAEEEFGGRLTLTNTTIAANQATTEGAGFYYLQYGDKYPGWLNLTNTLVADNDGANCAGDVDEITALGHNLSDDGSCLFTAAGNQINVDAQLGPLADNGGSTLTHALLAGSPAINAGNNSTCPTTDQRGVIRPQGANCDIGAFEAPVTTPPPTDHPTGNAGSFLPYIRN